MSLVQRLRADTAVDHDRVDARYAGFDLGDADGYARFLTAHGRALPAVERALETAGGGYPFRERSSLIAADLAELGVAMPASADFAVADAAEWWGAFYVLEGSRLGGGLLARQVPASLPSRYLAAVHERGEWRGILQAIDAAAIDADRAIAAARRVFDLYLRAA